MDELELLRRHDHPTQWEYPPGFDYRAATERFARFVEKLSTRLDTTLGVETGVDIQDASFHSQVHLPLPGNSNVVIRFSNFGDMVSLLSEGLPHESTTATILNLLAEHDYAYIPARTLEQPYTGSNPGVTGIDTWWIRYFDWV